MLKKREKLQPKAIFGRKSKFMVIVDVKIVFNKGSGEEAWIIAAETERKWKTNLIETKAGCC